MSEFYIQDLKFFQGSNYPRKIPACPPLSIPWHFLIMNDGFTIQCIIALFKMVAKIVDSVYCFPSLPASILKGCIKCDYLIKSHVLAFLCRNVILKATIWWSHGFHQPLTSILLPALFTIIVILAISYYLAKFDF